MKIATIPDMKTARVGGKGAFTIIELLMVIAIMAIVAGLIVALVSVSSDSRRINRTQAELAQLVTLIEAYKSKVGVYPPDNPNGNLPERNTLLYELVGAIRKNPEAANPTYETPFGSITKSQLENDFNLSGIVNAHDYMAANPTPGEENRSFPILKDLKRDQIGSVVPGTVSLVAAAPAPDGSTVNPWRYRVGNLTNTHNPESFDLWVEIKVRAGTNTIGNWKK